jgi:hypothetical protein
VFLAIAVFFGSGAAADKVVVVPLIDDAPNIHTTVFIKSNGQKIGVLTEMGDFLEPEYAGYWGLSSSEYYFSVRKVSGRPKTYDIYFTTSDCTGQAYLEMPDNYNFGPFTESQGLVFSSALGYSVPAYYVPRGTSTELKTVKSMWGSPVDPVAGECVPQDEQKSVYPILPNDPAVTGVKDSYPLPITAGF